MNKIAVDVVLIPPDTIIQLAVDINKTFPETVAENYVLDPKTCIPHITLLMGLITREQVLEVTRRLNALADTISSLNLTVTHIGSSANPSGRMISSLEVEKTPELQKLHETILTEISPLFSYDGVEKGMFYPSPPIYEIPMFWALGLARTSVREQYKPHITLGVGVPLYEIVPVQFTASKLALCHLGNYCTCRDMLWSTTLN